MPHKAKPRSAALRRKHTDQARRRIFLDKFAAVGLLTPSADAAGVSLKTVNEWFANVPGFREAFDEAKLRFHDRLEETIVNRIDGVAQRRNDTLLRFKIQGEIPEKYGRPGRKPKEKDHECMPDHDCLTWADIERAAREPYDDEPLP